MPNTEIVVVELVAGSEIGDPNNHAAAILKESCDTILSQDGCQQIHFGMQVENPTHLQMFIDWDEKASHDKFAAADHYEAFAKKFGSVFAGAPQIIHADLEPHGGKTAALSAPVTEVATFYHNDAPPGDHTDKAPKAIEALKQGGGGVKGFAYGETYETIERDGVKGKAAVAIIGWDTVEDHMAARQMQAFKDNISGLRNGAGAIEMHHVHVMSFIKE